MEIISNSLDLTHTQPLVEALNKAVCQGCPKEVVAKIRTVLCEFIQKHKSCVPAQYYQTYSNRYARRLIHRSDEFGYSAVAMTWGPQQGTPIHDHCGMWCVEGIWAGEIEVVQYELIENQDDRYRFESRACMQAYTGSAGSLIPPHEYHTIANPSKENIAVSIHIYSGDMINCNAFLPLGENWYREESRQLGFDS